MKKFLPLVFCLIISAGKTYGQIPNAGMETWIGFTYEEPQDWTTFNFFSFILGGPYTVNKTTDSYSGTFAATIESIEFTDTSGFDHELPGILFSGDQDGNGFPVNTRYADFSFWYKYNNIGGDTAIVATMFTKWNSATQSSDSVGVAFALITNTITSYTLMSVPFQYFNSETPDSAIIFVISNATEDFMAGSKLWVDDFNFSGISNINELSVSAIDMYPNPASTELIIETGLSVEGTIEIYDSRGRMVLNCDINGTRTIVSVANLSKSTYIYKIKDKSGKTLKAGKALLGQ